jgi:serine/threonine-protein kinase
MSALIGKVLGKYKITEKISSGTIADIYKGIQVGLEREVAIKVLSQAYGQDKDMVKRFRRESQATARYRRGSGVR